MSRNSLMACAAGFCLLLAAAGRRQPPRPRPRPKSANLTGNAAAGKQALPALLRRLSRPGGRRAGRERASGSIPSRGTSPPAVFKCRSTPTGTLPTDEDLYHAVTRGFVTTNMPPWLPLDPADAGGPGGLHQDLLPALEDPGGGDPDRSARRRRPATVESILHGRELFQKMECWKCHGPAGHGDGPSASTLTDSKDNPIRPYNFASGSRFKCGATNEDLYRIFMTGLDGTPMPSFADNIQPEDAWDLVHFLRTLQPAPDAGGRGCGRPGCPRTRASSSRSVRTGAGSNAT